MKILPPMLISGYKKVNHQYSSPKSFVRSDTGILRRMPVPQMFIFQMETLYQAHFT
jgi:hypothetical protein